MGGQNLQLRGSILFQRAMSLTSSVHRQHRPFSLICSGSNLKSTFADLLVLQ